MRLSQPKMLTNLEPSHHDQVTPDQSSGPAIRKGKTDVARIASSQVERTTMQNPRIVMDRKLRRVSCVLPIRNMSRESSLVPPFPETGRGAGSPSHCSASHRRRAFARPSGPTFEEQKYGSSNQRRKQEHKIRYACSNTAVYCRAA